MNMEDVRDLFNKSDTNADGFLTKQEFCQTIASLNLEISSEDVETFAKQVALDDRIGFNEFNHYVQYSKGSLAQHKFLIDMTGKAIGLAKQVERLIDVKTVNDGEPSLARVLLRDQDAKDADNSQSSVQLHVGDTEANPAIAKILGHKFDAPATLGFKFHVQNKELVVNNFGLYINALKEFLAEFGKEMVQALESINIQLVEVDDGVCLTVDPTSNAFTTSFVDILSASFDHLQKLRASLSLQIGTDANIGDKTLTYEQLVDSAFLFEVSGRAIRLSNVAQTPSVRAMIQAMSADPNGKTSLLASVFILSFRNVNAELNLNSEDRRQFVAQTDLKDLDTPIWAVRFNEAKKQLDESGLGDFLDSLDFVKSAANDLRNANCSAVSVFAKVHDVYAVLKIKADVYSALDELFNLQDK